MTTVGRCLHWPHSERTLQIRRPIYVPAPGCYGTPAEDEAALLH